MMKLITREAAKSAGLKRYYTGVPCRRGHIAERAVSNGTCWQCRPINKAATKKNPALDRERSRKWKRNNPNKVRAWYVTNLELTRARSAAWRKANPEQFTICRNLWTRRNPGRIADHKIRYYQANKKKVKAAARLWLKANPDKRRAIDARRRAAELRAIPVWAKVKDINHVYTEAARISAETGIVHHVDHVVPLRSKWVCGLHCLENLEIIPSNENQAKGNRFWPDMDAYKGAGSRAPSVE